MLKKVIALIFMAAFAMQTFGKVFIMFDYFTNTNAYAKNCENKAKPKLQCKGKCQMMKKIQQEEKKDDQNPERKAENKNEIALSSKSFYPNLQFSISVIPTQLSFLKPGKEIKMPRSLLRPPIC